ncbi:MAG: hypothetical protein J6L89_07235 [Clostridia bacterium]|nr:hypothetical protein [Clostridia bacterium]
MKKLIIALVVIAAVGAAGFGIYEAMFYNAWPVLQELPRYKEREIYSVDNFTDGSYYAKFTYRNVTEEDLKEAEDFSRITKEDATKILHSISCYEDFINNMGMEEITENYDFDKSVVTEDDYYYMESGEGFYQDENGNVSETGFISLYYFDTESQILYYFYNSI